MTAPNDLVQALGTFLAEAYIALGVWLALFAAWGVHLCLLAVLLYIVVRRKRARIFRVVCEVIYGLLNPLVYLTALRPGFISYEAAFWRALPLQTIGWLLLAFVWALRLAGAPQAERRQFAPVRRMVLWAALTCIVLFGIKDLLLIPQLQASRPGASIGTTALELAWLMAALAPLYLIPVVLIADFLRTESETPGAASRFFLLRGTPARIMGLAVGTLAILSFVVAIWRPSDEAARRTTLAHHDAIVAAASEYGVDPAVVAAIAYVTQRYQITPFRGTIERLAMAIWLWDPQSNFFLGPGLNISIGLTQIKPVTAQTAATLVHRGGDMKTVREVPALSWSLPKELTAPLQTPWKDGGDKADVVAALLDDRTNLKACALILALYQMQWQTDAHGSTIRDRPDILGTLFQIGFERSQPKTSPHSNAFGRQVQQVHDRSWLQEAFR